MSQGAHPTVVISHTGHVESEATDLGSSPICLSCWKEPVGEGQPQPRWEHLETSRAFEEGSHGQR